MEIMPNQNETSKTNMNGGNVQLAKLYSWRNKLTPLNFSVRNVQSTSSGLTHDNATI